MKRLWIVGAGGFGREILSHARDIQAAGQADWEIAGFLDSRPAILDGFDIKPGLRGCVEAFRPGPDDRFIVAIGDPDARLRYARMLWEKGGRFETLIHPSALIGERVTIGKGCFFGPLSGATCDSRIGDFVIFNSKSGAGHDTVIGEGCTLAAFAEVTGRARLGRCVSVGSHAVVLPGVHVEDGAEVFAGSVVARHAPRNARVGGNPARRVA
ncbi:MAG: hypothetical protein ACFB6R_15405 [Alphaproteobacteria bacterium]